MNSKRKLALAVVLVFAAALLLGGCAGVGQQGVGVLDVNKVMAESPKVKQFQEQLNAKGKELTDQLEKDKPKLSQEEFQKRQEAAYGEFLKTKQDLESQIDASIKQALDQVAKEKKLGIVLYKNGVAQGGTDITDDVIKKMQ
ncbi:OmpH family outer membrane protein [Sporolituus thermophilus]|uniref:Periplasmic chaperone for outer membrane proteins Skp n=1 Tax=Sporolituus thermophilus DSM 23256 TaxID=1123285 RepID=A0A1G7HFF4_9FIRM|nr:OmpH family outer membrane protein [Sporolituus thermophilus]SDE99033.1 periplasmic chaperone for outer membrane proteins Skp [Sporolituus thermophilus DSM 23256]